jgi:hypothetical protein
MRSVGEAAAALIRVRSEGEGQKEADEP